MTSAPRVPRVQKISAILWPSFVLAGTATVVFFTLLDPLVLFECEGEPPLTRIAAYSLGFLAFWLLCAASSVGSAYFLKPHVKVDQDGGTS